MVIPSTTAKTTTNKIVLKALTSAGIGCFATIFWIYVDIVSNDGSFKYWVITKSSSYNVIEIRKPEKIPGKISVSTTLNSEYQGVAPKSRAAS